MSYRILKGTTVWIVVDGIDETMITEKEVMYEEDDIKESLLHEYHFYLPSNDRQASWLIVNKKNVIEFEHIQL